MRERERNCNAHSYLTPQQIPRLYVRALKAIIVQKIEIFSPQHQNRGERERKVVKKNAKMNKRAVPMNRRKNSIAHVFH